MATDPDAHGDGPTLLLDATAVPPSLDATRRGASMFSGARSRGRWILLP